jgi:hypothetical protein
VGDAVNHSTCLDCRQMCGRRAGAGWKNTRRNWWLDWWRRIRGGSHTAKRLNHVLSSMWCDRDSVHAWLLQQARIVVAEMGCRFLTGRGALRTVPSEG